MINLKFIRHSTTNLNGKGYVATQKDFPLNEKGIKKCIENRFEQGEFDRVYCSPYKRTIQTAQLIYPYKEAEVSSLITQRNLGIMNEHFKYEYEIEYLSQIRDYLINPQGAETLNDIVKRLNDFLNIVSHENIDKSNILVVTHNGIMRIIKKEFLNNLEYEDSKNLGGFTMKLLKK